MGIITKFAAELAKGYVSERGVKGTMEDAVNLVQGVGNVGKKLFGSNGEENESDEYDEYESDEAETNSFDEKTWNELRDGIESLKEEGNYAGALKMLHDYYCQEDLDYFYFYLKADILLAKYDDLGRSPESDFSCKTEVDKAIEACEKYGDEDEELLMTIELQDKFESTKLKVSYWRKMKSLQDEIDALRDPEHVVTTSKVNDVLKAFKLVDNFWKEESTAEDGSVYNIDFFYLFKARIYNAFFFYLAENKQELDALSDEQLSEFFVGATDCADKVLAFSECDDKTDEEFLNGRIPEQIEELKQLRCGKKSSMHSSSSASVTSEEQEYLEEIRACLDNDGEISSRERRLLDRLRKTLGITEVRAKELEASVNDMSDDEKEYQEELKACLEDGTISDRERRLLDRLRKSLGISEERAKAIEDRLLKQ
jgi:hypothetical protein